MRLYIAPQQNKNLLNVKHIEPDKITTIESDKYDDIIMDYAISVMPYNQISTLLTEVSRIMQVGGKLSIIDIEGILVFLLWQNGQLNIEEINSILNTKSILSINPICELLQRNFTLISRDINDYKFHIVATKN